MEKHEETSPMKINSTELSPAGREYINGISIEFLKHRVEEIISVTNLHKA